jgi:hypothetical protein
MLDFGYRNVNRLCRKYTMAGWDVHIVAPEGVQMFEVDKIAVGIVETENDDIKYPISFELEASVK